MVLQDSLELNRLSFKKFGAAATVAAKTTSCPTINWLSSPGGCPFYVGVSSSEDGKTGGGNTKTFAPPVLTTSSSTSSSTPACHLNSRINNSKLREARVKALSHKRLIAQKLHAEAKQKERDMTCLDVVDHEHEQKRRKLHRLYEKNREGFCECCGEKYGDLERVCADFVDFTCRSTAPRHVTCIS